jgi:hypothetical protein
MGRRAGRRTASRRLIPAARGFVVTARGADEPMDHPGAGTVGVVEGDHPESFACCSHWPVGRGVRRRDALGAVAPVDDLGFVDLVARRRRPSGRGCSRGARSTSEMAPHDPTDDVVMAVPARAS